MIALSPFRSITVAPAAADISDDARSAHNSRNVGKPADHPFAWRMTGDEADAVDAILKGYDPRRGANERCQ